MTGAPLRVELRFRALTHVNVGTCAVDLHERSDAPWVCVVETAAGNIGPDVHSGARAVAAAIQRELVPAGVAWLMVERARDGACSLVEFGEAFGGWFYRPSWTPLAADVLAALLGAALPLPAD